MKLLGRRIFRRKRSVLATDEIPSAGITLVERKDSVLWANASLSLPARLSAEEALTVQQALERSFAGKTVRYSESLR